ncbi:MAG: hypothetical protein NC300_06115 [Bacteroidales bacterium]|nr:hypothetical protein [Clostridium sp.]MCM1159446.1 hypothetical protein [Clostridium sp.]MCM1203699.1 hypothetical protein [Bacteroidales bacterium]
MVKQGIKGIARFMSWTFKGAVWILVHILKLALAVLETVLLLAGNVLKMMLLVFHAGRC